MMMAGSSQVTGPSRKDVVAALSQPGNDEYQYNNDLLVCLIRKAEIGAAETGWHGGWRGMLDAFTIETIDTMVSDEQAWELDEFEYVPQDLNYEGNPHPQSRTNTYGDSCEDDDEDEYSITMQKRTATMRDILIANSSETMRITMRAGLCIMIPVVALVLFLMLMMSAYTSTFRNLVKMVTCALLLTLIGTQSEIATMVILQYTFVMFGMRNVTNGMPTMLDGMMVANEGYPHNRFCR
jgi:hypothetical protein